VVDSSNNKEQKKSRLFSGECPPQIVDEMKIEQASGRVTRKKGGRSLPNHWTESRSGNGALRLDRSSGEQKARPVKEKRSTILCTLYSTPYGVLVGNKQQPIAKLETCAHSPLWNQSC
jgi:hypothetical protein